MPNDLHLQLSPQTSLDDPSPCHFFSPQLLFEIFSIPLTSPQQLFLLPSAEEREGLATQFQLGCHPSSLYEAAKGNSPLRLYSRSSLPCQEGLLASLSLPNLSLTPLTPAYKHASPAALSRSDYFSLNSPVPQIPRPGVVEAVMSAPQYPPSRPLALCPRLQISMFLQTAFKPHLLVGCTVIYRLHPHSTRMKTCTPDSSLPLPLLSSYVNKNVHYANITWPPRSLITSFMSPSPLYLSDPNPWAAP